MFKMNYKPDSSDGNAEQVELSFSMDIINTTSNYSNISNGDSFGSVISNKIAIVTPLLEKEISSLTYQEKIAISFDPELHVFIAEALASMYTKIDENGNYVQNKATAKEAIESKWIKKLSNITSLKNILNETLDSMFG